MARKYVVINTNVLVSALITRNESVNAGEKFPDFAGLKFPLSGKKYINRSRRLRPSCGPSFCKNPPAGLQYGSGAEVCPDLQLLLLHRSSRSRSCNDAAFWRIPARLLRCLQSGLPSPERLRRAPRPL